MIALRDKFYVELADINGITVEEMKSLEDPNLPEAEKERLIEKMKNALVGDTRGLRPWAPIWRNVRQPKEAS